MSSVCNRLQWTDAPRHFHLCFCRHWQDFDWLFCGHVWMYIAQAWAARHDPSVLLVFYEDVKDDAEAQVRRMAHHMGVEADDGLIAAVVRLSRHDYMLAHSSQFDEHWRMQQRAALGGGAGPWC